VSDDDKKSHSRRERERVGARVIRVSPFHSCLHRGDLVPDEARTIDAVNSRPSTIISRGTSILDLCEITSAAIDAAKRDRSTSRRFVLASVAITRRNLRIFLAILSSRPRRFPLRCFSSPDRAIGLASMTSRVLSV